MAGLTLGYMLNAVSQKAMDTERSLIRLGLRFPFGGSLLLIAKRSGDMDFENHSI